MKNTFDHLICILGMLRKDSVSSKIHQKISQVREKYSMRGGKGKKNYYSNKLEYQRTVWQLQKMKCTGHQKGVKIELIHELTKIEYLPKINIIKQNTNP